MSDLTTQLDTALAGRYRIVRQLGRGGMATVLLAEDLKHDRQVAIKVLHPEITALLGPERFLREIGIASRLQHPNILPLYDSGEAQGLLYYVMPYVEGESLRERIDRERQLPIEDALRLAREAADALDYAHRQGVIHRDIKPENILLAAGHAVLADFGIARAVQAAGGTKLTETGTVLGTPAYMSPEQWTGGDLDGRSDVYSLACVLYEMLAGVPPFPGVTGDSLAHQHLSLDPPPVTSARRTVGETTARALTKALSKAPADRFATAAQFGEGLSTAATSVTPHPHVPGRRPALVVTGIIVFGLLVVLFLAFGIWRVTAKRDGPGVERATIRSLAVLPLENLSRDPEQEYFADGMTEELTTSLANLEGVSVISRTSTMRYKGTTKTIPQIARELGVDAVIGGSALRAGDEVRISAQLIEATTDRHLWAKSYQRSLANVLALQGEVAQAIASEIRVALTPQGKARVAGAPAVNPVAYEAYLKGRYEWSRRGPTPWLAIAHFERAIEADSGYAAAWAGLADVYVVLATTSYRAGMPSNLSVTPRTLHAKALEAVRTALRLDPHLAEAHTTLAALKHRSEYDWAGADAEFRTALALNPSYATAHQWYGVSLAVRGRLDEASAELARARELDPLSTIMQLNQGYVLLWRRRYEEAIPFFQQIVRSNPEVIGAHMRLGHAYHAKGMYRAALSELVTWDSLGGGDMHRDERIRAAVRAGDTRRYWSLAVANRERRARDGYVSPDILVVAYAQLGDLDRALHWVERSFEDQDPRLLFLLREAMLDPLRTDPRFVASLKKHGLEP